jgi:hypothetical protein
VVTKSVLNFGRSFQMSTVLTPQVLITEIQIFNSKESMFIITRPPEEDTFQELF